MIFRKSFEKTLYKSKKRYYNIIIKLKMKKINRKGKNNEERRNNGN